jgi:hypothetical protein
VDVLGLNLDLDLRDYTEDREPTNAMPAWEARAHELAACAELMQAGGVTDRDFDLNFLAPGERLFMVVRGGELIEPGQIDAAWLTRAQAISFRVRQPSGFGAAPAPTDVGTVVITNLRVAFQGATQARHWLFSELTGVINDDDAPVTYLRVSDDERLGGVAYPGAAAESFRLRLAVALAWADDNPRPYQPLLKAELEAHMARCPRP